MYFWPDFLKQKGAITVWAQFLRLLQGRIVRLNGGKGTEPRHLWWQESRLPDCKPVYINHGQDLRRYFPLRPTEPD